MCLLMKILLLLLQLCCLSKCMQMSTTSSDSEEEQKNLNKSMRDKIFDSIFDNYRSHERPNLHQPTLVGVNMKILAIFSIDVRTMDYYVDAYLRQNWTDPRLSWNDNVEFSNYSQIVSPKLRERIWLPDLFFRNGKQGYLHEMTLPNYLIRLEKNGAILYSQKITMRFSCQMNLQNFPMDTQNCDINIGSYAYTREELRFHWRSNNPIEKTDNLQISEFNTPKNITTYDCSKESSTSTGNYTCLKAEFELKRQLGSYLATTYIPNVLIIIASWLSFWVSVDAAPARVPLGLLSLLGILTQATGVTSNLPRVSYIKAIDIWTIFSIIFVIGVLVEYAVALTMLRRKRADSWHRDVNEIVRQELARWCAACQQQQMMECSQTFAGGQLGFCEGLESLITQQVVDQHNGKTRQSKPPSLAESEVDVYSRFLFPSCYVLYNCFYWFYYLILVEYLQEMQDASEPPK